MLPELCLAPIASRSKYDSLVVRRCYREKGHAGKCHQFPYLLHLDAVAPKVAAKIERDSTMTTGAAWSSDDAGPNRILRWVMLESDEELLQFGIKMRELKPQVVAKLREKAAPYEACMEVAAKLAWTAYQMADAPPPPPEVTTYLEKRIGAMIPGSTTCVICREPLSFALFDQAKRGKALIETCHRNPRLHNAENVGFAHRACNIAQGDKTLEEFYAWIHDILVRASRL